MLRMKTMVKKKNRFWRILWWQWKWWIGRIWIYLRGKFNFWRSDAVHNVGEIIFTWKKTIQNNFLKKFKKMMKIILSSLVKMNILMMTLKTLKTMVNKKKTSIMTYKKMSDKNIIKIRHWLRRSNSSIWYLRSLKWNWFWTINWRW
jgi:serine kinase of HPr protein (carbohydrate metabolism regulator)